MNDEELIEYYNKCIEYCRMIKNPVLKEVANRVYNDYKENLFNKSATNSHHYYKGGLLYHMYSVTRNAIAICGLYSDLQIDMDLIIFGSLVHDIGKIKDYNDFTRDEVYVLKSGNSGTLLGHSNEGTHIIENYLDEYELNEQFKNQILHMIGSHMKEYSEWGVLVLPKMLEVIIINFADNIDSYIELAYIPIKEVKNGEVYKINNSPRNYYKSLNPYYK